MLIGHWRVRGFGFGSRLCRRGLVNRFRNYKFRGRMVSQLGFGWQVLQLRFGRQITKLGFGGQVRELWFWGQFPRFRGQF